MTSSTATRLAELPAKPRPEAIDAAAEEYLQIEAEIEKEQSALDKKLEAKRARLAELGEELRAMCVAWGSAHEKKSKLLTGLVFEVMTTVSTSSSLDQAAVSLFLAACKKAGKSRLFKKIFEVITLYRTRPDADAATRTDELTPALASAFLKCTLSKTSEPRLSAVRPRKKAAATAASAS